MPVARRLTRPVPRMAHELAAGAIARVDLSARVADPYKAEYTAERYEERRYADAHAEGAY